MQVECSPNYRDDILESAQILKKCVQLESSLETLSPKSQEELENMKHSINTSILQLNKQFLMTSSSEEAASAAVLKADIAAHQCKSRLDRAGEGDLDLDGILALYADPIAVTPTDTDSQRTKLNFRTYAKFVGALLRSRYPDVPDPPIELITRWFAEYQREQLVFEDIEAIGDAEYRPFCPISGRELEEPVRAPCGHVFSRQHIHQVFANNPTILCPSRGCSERFSEASSIRDHLEDIRVKIWKRKEALDRQSETLGSSAV